MKVILVTGSRDWSDGAAVFAALDQECPDVVIHGAAGGADTDASMYAGSRCTEISMPANWEKHGRSAGPRRNEAMVQVLMAYRSIGADCKVLAFPLGESKGTRGCMRIARRAAFHVENRGDE